MNIFDKFELMFHKLVSNIKQLTINRYATTINGKRYYNVRDSKGRFRKI